MTTDRDTLREAIKAILIRLNEGGYVGSGGAEQAEKELGLLIDAHDNALKEQTETDILGRLPASSRTCTCTTCRVVTGKLNQVFSKGETDD